VVVHSAKTGVKFRHGAHQDPDTKTRTSGGGSDSGEVSVVVVVVVVACAFQNKSARVKTGFDSMSFLSPCLTRIPFSVNVFTKASHEGLFPVVDESGIDKEIDMILDVLIVGSTSFYC
jgi:hypothetical protein